MNNELIVLLHGIGRTSASMNKMARSFKTQGYDVCNIDYPSRKLSIQENTAYVYQKINEENRNDVRTHFVGFSLGCILIRELLTQYHFAHIGNTVMLAPPNQGSPVADFWQNIGLYKYLYGPSGQQLTTQHAKHTPFANMKTPFGVIAGNRCIDPLAYFMLPKNNDGKVAVEDTKLDGMLDHLILPCTHTFMIYDNEVILQTLYFLKHQQFSKNFIT